MKRSEMPAPWQAHDQSIRGYLRAHKALGWGRRLLGLAFLAGLLGLGWSRDWEAHLLGRLNPHFGLWLAYFGGLAAVTEALSLPFAVAGHWVERSHQLSKQTYRSWFWDRVKGWVLGAVLGSVVLGVFFLSQRLWRPYWWVGSATFLVFFSVLLAQLAPVVLIPLFFTLKPLEGGSLRTRLLELCKRYGVAVDEVYHLGMSDKTEKGNAAFTGLGRTKRILIGDTLYKDFPENQVEAVFAHELGHQVHNDLWRGIGLSALSLFLSFAVADLLCRTWVEPWMDAALETPQGMLGFFVVLGVVQLPLGWLSLAFSRHREREADRFAAETTGLAAPLADSLERLTYKNRTLFRPSWFAETFKYSHPAPWRRIVTLRGGVAERREGT